MSAIETQMGWRYVCKLDELPVLGARVVERSTEAGGNVAVFRNDQDAVFALLDRCPHKGGPLSQGIVFGERVACPLHNWSIELKSGEGGSARCWLYQAISGPG